MATLVQGPSDQCVALEIGWEHRTFCVEQLGHVRTKCWEVQGPKVALYVECMYISSEFMYKINLFVLHVYFSDLEGFRPLSTKRVMVFLQVFLIKWSDQEMGFNGPLVLSYSAICWLRFFNLEMIQCQSWKNII